LSSSLDKLVAKLLGNFAGERRQSSFRAATVPSGYCAHSGRLDVKVRQSKDAGQDTAINVNILNAVVGDGYIFFVDNPKLFAKTSVGEFVTVVMVSEFGPDEAQGKEGRNDDP